MSVEAIIVVVKGSDIRVSDSFTGKRSEYGNYVVARETASGTEHTFVNGSINQVKPEDRVVGKKGTISWMKSSSYNLPTFSS